MDSLTLEERYRFYKLVRVQLSMYPSHGLEISWAVGEAFSVCVNETSPASSPGSTCS
jgi:hypothetical protein